MPSNELSHHARARLAAGLPAVRTVPSDPVIRRPIWVLTPQRAMPAATRTGTCTGVCQSCPRRTPLPETTHAPDAPL